jgi:hypothetical protein
MASMTNYPTFSFVDYQPTSIKRRRARVLDFSPMAIVVSRENVG